MPPPMSPAADSAMRRALDDVAAERHRQHARWGEQNHPDGTGGTTAVAIANEARDACDRRFAAGHGRWSDIFLEEVYEAVAEHDPQRLRIELVQAAAVAVSWIEAIDRRTNGGLS